MRHCQDIQSYIYTFLSFSSKLHTNVVLLATPIMRSLATYSLLPFFVIIASNAHFLRVILDYDYLPGSNFENQTAFNLENQTTSKSDSQEVSAPGPGNFAKRQYLYHINKCPGRNIFPAEYTHFDLSVCRGRNLAQEWLLKCSVPSRPASSLIHAGSCAVTELCFDYVKHGLCTAACITADLALQISRALSDTINRRAVVYIISNGQDIVASQDGSSIQGQSSSASQGQDFSSNHRGPPHGHSRPLRRRFSNDYNLDIALTQPDDTILFQAQKISLLARDDKNQALGSPVSCNNCSRLRFSNWPSGTGNFVVDLVFQKAADVAKLHIFAN